MVEFIKSELAAVEHAIEKYGLVPMYQSYVSNPKTLAAIGVKRGTDTCKVAALKPELFTGSLKNKNNLKGSGRLEIVITDSLIQEKVIDVAEQIESDLGITVSVYL